MKKAVIVFVATGLILCLLTGCMDSSAEANSWSSFSPVPFGGYICGFEKQEVLIQLPFFYYTGDSLAMDDISHIALCGEDAELDCKFLQMLKPKRDEKSPHGLSTLVFHAVLPSAGVYHVNKIQISLHDKRTIVKPLGNIMFEVRQESQWSDEMIFASEFMINQRDYSVIKVTYENKNSDTVEITDVSYPDDLYSNVSIRKYADLECSMPEEGLQIPAGEKRTFVFSFEPEKNYFSEEENAFLFLLPFVEFSSGAMTDTVPMQSQPLVIQPAFSESFIEKLLEAS